MIRYERIPTNDPCDDCTHWAGSNWKGIGKSK